MNNFQELSKRKYASHLFVFDHLLFIYLFFLCVFITFRKIKQRNETSTNNDHCSVPKNSFQI